MIIKELKKITEQEYRELPLMNYSACKEFDDDRMTFYKRYILKEPVKREDSKQLIFGRLVHCLLLAPDQFDSNFTRLEAETVPLKPQMKAFCNTLIEVTLENTDENGIVTSSMESMLQESYNRLAFDRNGQRVSFKRDSFEDVVEKFIGSEAENYYLKARENYKKAVIDSFTYSLAEKCVSELLTNETTEPILSIKDSDRYTVLQEQPITFTYNEVEMKALCDLIIIDHLEKKVYVYDIKSTGWDIELFPQKFFKDKYYLQASIYHVAIENLIKYMELTDYQAVPMKFITVSTDMVKRPLIYELDHFAIQKGLDGFEYNDKIYKGVSEILAEIKWHTEKGLWSISKENYENKGVKKLKF